MTRSIEAYQRALQFDGVPGWTHRSLGLAYWSEGQTGAAYNAFKRYLTASPKAEDRAMVRAYIKQLQ